MEDEIEILPDDQTGGLFVDNAFKMYMKEIQNYPVLSVEEQKELGRRYKNGDLEAGKRLINCNLRLVVSVAFHYKERLKHLQILDIIQEGNVGLMRALEGYDPEIGAFTTYAIPWIRQKINYGLADNDDEIRKPNHVIRVIYKYKALIVSYKQKGLPIPSDQDICNILGIEKETLKKIVNFIEQAPISLNQIVDINEETELGSFIADENNDYDNVINEMINNDLLIVLKEVLDPLHYYIIYNRFLIEEPKTVYQVATNLKISRERVRQIESKILRKLKPYMEENSIAFANAYNKLKQKEGLRFKFLKKTPVSPNQIIVYMYVKDDLTLLESKLYELRILDKYNYRKMDLLNILEITTQELEQLEDSLKTKISEKLRDEKAFEDFKNQIVKRYGTKIFKMNFNKAERIIDYHDLIEKYSSFSLEEILAYFKDINYSLNPDEEKLLERYFKTSESKMLLARDSEEECMDGKDKNSINELLYILDKRRNESAIKILALRKDYRV